MGLLAIYISVFINCPPAEAYAFVRREENLPKWASGLSGSTIKQEGDFWIADAPMGRVKIKFAAENTFGVLDHDVTLENGQTFHNPMRVMPNGTGSEVVFTLFRQPEMSDADFNKDRATIEKDLRMLKQLLEKK